MATLGSKLVTKDMEWTANMTELNHLGKALLVEPTKLGGTMDQLFSAKNVYSDNPLLSVLMGNKTTEDTIDSMSWEWEVKGASSRPLVVLENVEAGNTTPGRYRRPFKLKLDQDWFKVGDVLCPGADNKKFQARVVDFVRDGEGWVYTLRMMTDGKDVFMPVKFLKVGTQWAKLFAQYEEGAKEGGSTTFSTPLALKNSMSKFRKEYEITDYASTAVLAVGVPDKKGKVHKSWIRYAEVEYWQQWYRELERGSWYTRSAKSVLGSTGRPVTSGPGVQEQLEDSHIEYYSHLNVKLIEEYLMDIFYSRTKPGQGRKVRGYTGEYGMMEFHRIIQDWMNKSGFIKNVEVFTSKVSSDLNENALQAGYQFVRYVMANGLVLELIHNPLYDDREINFEIDPITGYPVASQRITFLDFASEGKESNVKLKKKKDGEAFTYVEGLYGPYGPKRNGGSSAHSRECYEMHVSKVCGVHIHDITRCGELILQRN